MGKSLALNCYQMLPCLNHSIFGIGMALAWHEMVALAPSSTRTSFSVAMKEGGSPSTVSRVVLFAVWYSFRTTHVYESCG